MNVGDICTREVVMADCATSLQQAATLMREHHVGTLVATASALEGAQAIGIVTDRDLVIEAVARGLDMAETELGWLLHSQVAAVPASATIDEALEAMRQHGVRRLLVRGDGEQLHGIVSLDDLLCALADEMSEVAHAVESGLDREWQARAPLPPAALETVRVPVA